MTVWSYGGYIHPTSEVNLRRASVRYRMSPRGRRLGRIVTLDLQGELQETGAALQTRINELIDVYSADYRDGILKLDDGTITPHCLFQNNADNISGVHVLQRSWDKGDAAELATRRTFSITLQAEFSDVDSQIVAYEESIEFIGNGGPDIEVVSTYKGPKAQTNALKTVQRIVQSGSSIGYGGYVLPIGSLFPAIEHQNLRREKPGTPRQVGNGFAYYPFEWTYVHSSPTPIITIPIPR